MSVIVWLWVRRVVQKVVIPHDSVSAVKHGLTGRNHHWRECKLLAIEYKGLSVQVHLILFTEALVFHFGHPVLQALESVD